MRKILISLFALALILSSLVYIPATFASPRIGEIDELSHSQSTAPADIPATIDVYPDELTPSTPDRVVRAYIELPDGYDVNDIDVSTVKLNGTVPAFSGPAEIGDYDNDGVPDAMVKFYRYAVEQLLPQGDNVQVTVGGEVNGTTFEGNDYIRVNKGSAYGYGYP